MNTSFRISIVLAALAAGCANPLPVGMSQGTLGDCPSSPNCVSTEASDDDRRIEPLVYEGDRSEAMARLVEAMKAAGEARVVVQTDAYLHVEFRTASLRYVDDVEAYFPEGTGEIRLRSASREGWYDLGANRRRVERIREKFEGT